MHYDLLQPSQWVVLNGSNCVWTKSSTARLSHDNLLIDNLPDNIQFNCIIFIAHLASSKPNLGHFRRNPLTSNFNHFPLLQHQLKGHQELQNMVGFLSSAQSNLMHRLNVLTCFLQIPKNDLKNKYPPRILWLFWQKHNSSQIKITTRNAISKKDWNLIFEEVFKDWLAPERCLSFLKTSQRKKNNINEKCYQRIIHHEAFSKFLNKNLCITAVQSHGS